MKPTVLFVLAVSLLATAPWSRSASAEGIVVEEAFARATLGARKVSAAYLTINNETAEDDRLIGLSSPPAKKVMLHETVEEGGVMKMQALDGLDIKAGDSVVLEPGGKHLMLMGLEETLKEGDSIHVVLTFEKAGDVLIDVPVLSPAAKQAAQAGGYDHSGHGQKHDTQGEAKGHDHSQHGKSGHGHGKPIAVDDIPAKPAVEIAITADAVGGWNLHVMTENFRFAPEHASGEHVMGEGHGHVYVNGKKLARLYGPWFHIGNLPAGHNEIVVSLNANDHRHYSLGGENIAAKAKVMVAD